ncbi:hypothetical protein ACIBW9_19145 [Streptomyces sp. NPDC049541]|uniref:hypothetical protein n=1 Tax=Streptomyces sp. NPDC049541 TaxID=3365594 RepID=UPI0037887F5A
MALARRLLLGRVLGRRAALTEEFSLESERLYLSHASLADHLRAARPGATDGALAAAARAAQLHGLVESLPEAMTPS